MDGTVISLTVTRAVSDIGHLLHWLLLSVYAF